MKIFKFMIPEVVFGKGTISLIGESAKRLGASNVFVVSDPGVAEAGWVDHTVNYLKETGLGITVWTDVTSNTKDCEADRATEAYLQADCDVIVGLGGGSAIDAAKAVAILAANGGKIKDYEGVDKIKKPLPPIICAPTTAGAGAEVSQFSIIVDTVRKVKMSIVSKCLLPDMAIIDPIFLSTKDEALTAHTGMDALSHAIEAYVSVAATPMTDVYALHALRLISTSLRASVASKTNEEAKTTMAMASLLAGIAFSNAVLGAVHAMSHPLGGLLDMPHGEVNSVLLPHVMRFNLVACVDKYARIAEALGERVEGLSPREAAEKAINAVELLRSDIGIKSRLSDLGLKKEHIPSLSEAAVVDACLLTNPRDADIEEIAEIYHKAF